MDFQNNLKERILEYGDDYKVHKSQRRFGDFGNI